MPYNTRRKSLSLPSLGIHVPVSNAVRAAQAASRANANNQSAGASASNASPKMTSPSRDESHLSKKVKRSHGEMLDVSAQQPSPARKREQIVKLEHTPPPSPPDSRASVEMEDAVAEDQPAPNRTIDMREINDDIVEAVIMQLQATMNRPHLVKELALALYPQLKVVQQSANQPAIISSRLATYMKRPCWTSQLPCPIAKELETVHPRRTYFYLTTSPHQPLPDTSSRQVMPRVAVTPSLSSGTSASEEADADMDRRREFSPSPEIDLSPPEFDGDDDTFMTESALDSLTMRLPSLKTHSVPSSRHHRGTSPPLEKDEKEFTQTADGLQKRKLTGGLLSAAPIEQKTDISYDVATREDNLFGDANKALGLTVAPVAAFITSPAIRPTFALNLKKDDEAESWAKLDTMLGWDRSPETIELEELDGLLIDF